jgi:hypothetical protein
MDDNSFKELSFFTSFYVNSTLGEQERWDSKSQKLKVTRVKNLNFFFILRSGIKKF